MADDTRFGLPETTRAERRRLARAEAEHFTALMADEQVRLIENFLLPDNVAGAPRRCAAVGGRVQ